MAYHLEPYPKCLARAVQTDAIIKSCLSEFFASPHISANFDQTSLYSRTYDHGCPTIDDSFLRRAQQICSVQVHFDNAIALFHPKALIITMPPAGRMIGNGPLEKLLNWKLALFHELAHRVGLNLPMNSWLLGSLIKIIHSLGKTTSELDKDLAIEEIVAEMTAGSMMVLLGYEEKIPEQSILYVAEQLSPERDRNGVIHTAISAAHLRIKLLYDIWNQTILSN